MAKIPSFKQNNRMESGAPVQLLNSGQARMQGEAVANLGQAVQRFGGQMDDYYREKRRVDNALFAAEVQNKASITAQEAETYAKTRPDAARDGSDVRSSFGEVFDPFKESILEIDDREKRAIALQAINGVEASHRNKLVTYEVSRHNAFVLEKASDVLNDYSFRVQQDPTQTAQTLQEFDSLANQMPFEGENKKNFMQTGRKQIVTSALESFASKGNYDAAKSILNSTQAGALFSIDERKKLSQEYVNREIKDANFKWSTDSHEHAKMKRDRVDMQDQNAADIFGKLIKAESPELRTNLLKEAQALRAQQLISPQALNALEADQTQIAHKQSSDLRRNYIVQSLEGKTLEQIRPQVMADMKEGRMSHQDGLGVLSSLSAQAKKEAADPIYKQEKTVAKSYIKSRVQPSGLGSFGLFHNAEQKMTLARIDEEVLALEAKGMRPLEAAKMATAKVVGLQALTNSMDPEINKINDNEEALNKYAQVIEQRYQKAIAAGKATPTMAREKMRQIHEIKARINGVQMRKEHEYLTKIQEKQPQ